MQTELVDRARRGDREAFSVLAGGAVDRLFAIARLILRDAELAEDATQEALVRAWRDLPTLRDVERFDAWLYRLIVRASADVGRHRRRWRAEITILPSEPAEPDRTSELADRDQLERALRRVSDDQRPRVGSRRRSPAGARPVVWPVVSPPVWSGPRRSPSGGLAGGCGSLK